MSITSADIKDFINSKNYDAFLKLIQDSIDIEINDQPPPSAVLGYDADKVNASNLNLSDLNKLLLEDSEKIVRFVKIKLTELQDTHEQERQDPDEQDEIIAGLPFYKSFTIGYLVEFQILKNSPEALENYVKRIRIPYYKKYAKELITFFNKASQDDPRHSDDPLV